MKNAAIRAMVLAVLLLFLGCGAVHTTQAINSAEEELLKARQTDPLEHPDTEYAYWSSVEYLKEAKVQEGRSHYRQAQYYAKKSIEFSLAARNEGITPSPFDRFSDLEIEDEQSQTAQPSTQDTLIYEQEPIRDEDW